MKIIGRIVEKVLIGRIVSTRERDTVQGIQCKSFEIRVLKRLLRSDSFLRIECHHLVHHIDSLF